jgi:hypothetical protein
MIVLRVQSALLPIVLVEEFVTHSDWLLTRWLPVLPMPPMPPVLPVPPVLPMPPVLPVLPVPPVPPMPPVLPVLHMPSVPHETSVPHVIPVTLLAAWQELVATSYVSYAVPVHARRTWHTLHVSFQAVYLLSMQVLVQERPVWVPVQERPVWVPV